MKARALAELTAGILTVPADVAVSDLTLDSRAVTPGTLFLACRGLTQHGASSPPRRWRAVRVRCCTSATGHRRCRQAAAPMLRLFPNSPARSASSPTASSARPRTRSPWPASPAPTARPPAPGCWRRRSALPPSGGLHRHARLRPAPAPDGDRAHDLRCRDGAAPAGAAARGGRRMRVHGGVLARPRPGARQRRAFQHRGLHQPDARSPRLSRHHGRLRCGEGAPVRLAAAELPGHQHR